MLCFIQLSTVGGKSSVSESGFNGVRPCLPSLRSVWFPPGCRRFAGDWKASTRRKEVRTHRTDRPTFDIYCQSFHTCDFTHYCKSVTLACAAALEPPRRASDRHTPAKRLAPASVCVTSWRTLRTSPWGTEAALIGQTPRIKLRWTACGVIHNLLSFQIQEPRPPASVHVPNLDRWRWGPIEKTQGKLGLGLQKWMNCCHSNINIFEK